MKKDPKNAELFIYGIPSNVPETEAAICRSRLLNAVSELTPWITQSQFNISIGTEETINHQNPTKNDDSDDLFDLKKRAKQYESQTPFYSFDNLIVSSEVKEELLSNIELIKVEKQVFDEWGLRDIEPFPRTALNFYGPPGTGKTLAAHALADYLKYRILVASYAEIESKFHGDGPKNVKAIFYAAERDRAVLFIDEADSLLSKRLTNVTQGSEQAINSMRSQLLICLEQFKGIVIFSTNLVENYDKAFETRIRHVHFDMPDKECRYKIWKRHLVDKLPKSGDVDLDRLAIELKDICGRDIKNAVLDSAVRVAREKREHVSIDDLISAVDRIKQGRIHSSSVSRNLNDDEIVEVEGKIKESLSQKNNIKQTGEANE